MRQESSVSRPKHLVLKSMSNIKQKVINNKKNNNNYIKQ